MSALGISAAAEEIREIGRRLYARGFAAGHDGNLSYRLSEDRVLCTPTKISKGAMTPRDLCLVDLDGKQIAGVRARTSEVLLHLELMKARPSIRGVVHCHPPCATAFGIAREALPQRILPEVEVLLGEVPIAAYSLPGSPALAAAILPFVQHSQIIIQANHGTVAFGNSVEEAFWYTEILDAYTQILLRVRELGHVEYLSAEEMQALLALKSKIGLTDPRSTTFDNQNSREADFFRDTWNAANIAHRAFSPPYAENK